MSLPSCTAPDVAVLYDGAFMCKSAVPRYVDNGDGTVTHNLTGLMWEQKLASSDARFAAGTPDVHCVQNLYRWSAANPYQNPDGSLFTDFLAKLNGGDYYSPVPAIYLGTPVLGLDVSAGVSACFANHCDWRIPTIAELAQLVETTAAACDTGGPCIDAVFGPTQASFYWSSSSLAGNPGLAWDVYFGYGNPNDGSLDGKGGDYYARAVRGGR